MNKYIAIDNGSFDSDNYRPINLLNLFVKIFEKIMCNRPLRFSKRFKVFNKQKHSFAGGKNTKKAPYSFTQMITEDISSFLIGTWPF